MKKSTLISTLFMVFIYANAQALEVTDKTLNCKFTNDITRCESEIYHLSQVDSPVGNFNNKIAVTVSAHAQNTLYYSCEVKSISGKVNANYQGEDFTVSPDSSDTFERELAAFGDDRKDIKIDLAAADESAEAQIICSTITDVIS